LQKRPTTGNSDIAAKTGNTYVGLCGTITDSVKLPTANLASSTTTTRPKCSQVIATTTDSEKWQDWRLKRLYYHFRLSIVVAIARDSFIELWVVKTRDLSSEF